MGMGLGALGSQSFVLRCKNCLGLQGFREEAKGS